MEHKAIVDFLLQHVPEGPEQRYLLALVGGQNTGMGCRACPNYRRSGGRNGSWSCVAIGVVFGVEDWLLSVDPDDNGPPPLDSTDCPANGTEVTE